MNCHLYEYRGTTDPNHQAAGFPTDCEICPDTTSWAGAGFDHSWPLVSIHAFSPCSECHLTPPVHSNFRCTHCHTHNEINSTSDYDRVSRYIWSSPECVACHPDGEE